MPFLDAIARDMHKVDSCVSVEDYLKVLNRSKVWRYEWGVILADGDEIHMHIMPNYRKKVFLRKQFREVTKYLFEHYPVIKTSILNKPELLEFELRTGWKVVSSSEYLINLEMKKEDFNF